MVKRLRRFLLSFIRIILVPFGFACLLGGVIITASVRAQNIGGPYQPDEHTVLLLHFNEDFQNESDYFEVAQAELHGNLRFLSMAGAGSLGNQLRIDNDSPSDKSHIQIPDSDALDLTGSWTLEMWVNVFTYGSSREDWRRQPRLLFKPGDPDEAHYYNSNYFMNIFTGKMDFRTGYYTEEGNNFISLISPSDMMKIGEWFHVTFIRDASKGVMIQMLHQNKVDPGRLPHKNNDELELVHYEEYNYELNGKNGAPRTSNQPLFIGVSPQHDTLFANLDGFIDEVRISNIARDFDINYTPPPVPEPEPEIIAWVSTPDYHFENQKYTVETNVHSLDEDSVTLVRLHYRVDSTSWNQREMSRTASNTFEASIPPQNAGSFIEYGVQAWTQKGFMESYPPDGSLLDFDILSLEQNRAPLIQHSFSDTTLEIEVRMVLDLETLFEDPDNDPMHYAASHSNSEVLLASVEDTLLTIMGSSAGTDEVTVSAFDGHGHTTELTFTVTVKTAPTIQFIHNVPSGDSLDIYLHNTERAFIPGFRFGEATDLRKVVSGDSVGVYVTLSGTKPQIDPHLKIKLAGDRNYQVVLNRKREIIAAHWLDQDLAEPDPTRVKARLINGIPSALDTGFRLTNTEEENYEINFTGELQFGDFSSYISFKPSEAVFFSTAHERRYTFDLWDAGGEVLTFVTTPAEDPTGQETFTVTAFNTSGATYHPVQVTSTNDDKDSKPDKIALIGNYPNPYNPTTTITFSISTAAKVKLSVFNMLGQKVATLVNKKISAGEHQVVFDATELTNGVYIYRMQTGSFSDTRKMLLIK